MCCPDKHANKEADFSDKMCEAKKKCFGAALCAGLYYNQRASQGKNRLPAVMLLPCELPLKKDRKIIILSIFMNMNINTIHIQVHADEQHTIEKEKSIEKGLKSISTLKNVALDCCCVRRGTQGFVPSQNMSSAICFFVSNFSPTPISCESQLR